MIPRCRRCDRVLCGGASCPATTCKLCPGTARLCAACREAQLETQEHAIVGLIKGLAKQAETQTE